MYELDSISLLVGIFYSMICFFYGVSLNYFFKQRKTRASLGTLPHPKPRKMANLSHFFSRFKKPAPLMYDLEGKIIAPEPIISTPIHSKIDSDTTATLPEVEREEIISEVVTMDLTKLLGYCMKCRTKKVIKDPKIVDVKTTKGEKRFIKGTCFECGTKMACMVKKE
jgi:hypothetical protein